MAVAWAACGEEALVKGFNGALSPDGTSRDVLARGRWRDYSPGICDALVTGYTRWAKYIDETQRV